MRRNNGSLPVQCPCEGSTDIACPIHIPNTRISEDSRCYVSPHGVAVNLSINNNDAHYKRHSALPDTPHIPPKIFREIRKHPISDFVRNKLGGSTFQLKKRESRFFGFFTFFGIRGHFCRSNTSCSQPDLGPRKRSPAKDGSFRMLLPEFFHFLLLNTFNRFEF